MMAPIQEVIRGLGGPDLRGRRLRAWWRDGSRDSVAVDVRRGLWHDHATGDGGDAVDLVRVVLGLSMAEALAWLEREGYRQPARRLTTREITEQRRRREVEERRRIDIADYRRALDGVLDRLKLSAVEAGNDHALERAASLQYRLSMTPAAVMTEMLATDDARVAWLIAQGREDRQHATEITRLVVDILAASDKAAVAHAA